jgi:hypothetical protein
MGGPVVSRAVAYCISVVAIGAIVAGCGGGDSTGSGDSNTIKTSSLTKAQFVEHADAICSAGSARILERISAYMKEHESNSQSEAELVAKAIHATALPELEKQFDEIEDLGAPEGEQGQVEALLAALREGIVAAEKRRRMSIASNVAPEFRRAGALSRKYGIEACAYG